MNLWKRGPLRGCEECVRVDPMRESCVEERGWSNWREEVGAQAGVA